MFYWYLKTKSNLQLITYTILHDLSLLCSIIISYPLYFSYFLFFFPYLIKLISFVSPLFITTVFISFSLTTTLCHNLPRHEFGILHIIINTLKNNLDEVHGYDKDRDIEEFDIYRLVFENTTLSVQKMLESSVHRGRRNDNMMKDLDINDKLCVEEMVEGYAIERRRDEDADSDKLCVENTLESFVGRIGWGNGDSVNYLDTNKMCVENMLESSFTRGWKNGNAVNGSDIADKLCVEEMLESYFQGGWNNGNAVNGLDIADELRVEKTLESSFQCGRENDNAVNGSDIAEKLCVEETLESSFQGGWNNGNAVNGLDIADKLRVEKTLESSFQGGRENDNAVNGSDIAEKLCVEETLESSFHSGLKSENVVNGSDIADKLCMRDTLESLPHGCQRDDVIINDLDTDDLCVENTLESVVKIANLCVEELKNVKRVEKLLEEVDRFEEFTMANETDANFDTQMQKSVGWSSWRANSLNNINSHGSMKEEKEWRRTLGGILFEERQNSLGGEEGMDSLWEEYETDYSKNQKNIMTNNNNSNSNDNSNDGTEMYDDQEEVEDENVDGEEEMTMSSGYLCCLQALKLSTRKMNMGVGRPNLLKITKALKGFGWLHQVKNKGGKTSLGSFMG